METTEQEIYEAIGRLYMANVKLTQALQAAAPGEREQDESDTSEEQQQDRSPTP